MRQTPYTAPQIGGFCRLLTLDGYPLCFGVWRASLPPEFYLRSGRRIRVAQLDLFDLIQRLRVERELRRGDVLLQCAIVVAPMIDAPMNQRLATKPIKYRLRACRAALEATASGSFRTRRRLRSAIGVEL